MSYHTQQAMLAKHRRQDEAAMIWCCSIENTARRWGPPEVLELSTGAYNAIKAKDYAKADQILDELLDLILELLSERDDVR